MAVENSKLLSEFWIFSNVIFCNIISSSWFSPHWTPTMCAFRLNCFNVHFLRDKCTYDLVQRIAHGTRHTCAFDLVQCIADCTRHTCAFNLDWFFAHCVRCTCALHLILIAAHCARCTCDLDFHRFCFRCLPVYASWYCVVIASSDDIQIRQCRHYWNYTFVCQRSWTSDHVCLKSFGDLFLLQNLHSVLVAGIWWRIVFKSLAASKAACGSLKSIDTASIGSTNDGTNFLRNPGFVGTSVSSFCLGSCSGSFVNVLTKRILDASAVVSISGSSMNMKTWLTETKTTSNYGSVPQKLLLK